MFTVALWIILVLMIISSGVSFIRIFTEIKIEKRVVSFVSSSINLFGCYVFLLQLGYFH